MKVDECGDKSILKIADVEHMEFMGETCCDVVVHKTMERKNIQRTSTGTVGNVCKI